MGLAVLLGGELLRAKALPAIAAYAVLSPL